MAKIIIITKSLLAFKVMGPLTVSHLCPSKDAGHLQNVLLRLLLPWKVPEVKLLPPEIDLPLPEVANRKSDSLIQVPPFKHWLTPKQSESNTHSARSGEALICPNGHLKKKDKKEKNKQKKINYKR